MRSLTATLCTYLRSTFEGREIGGGPLPTAWVRHEKEKSAQKRVVRTRMTHVDTRVGTQWLWKYVLPHGRHSCESKPAPQAEHIFYINSS
ncbi:hypothetical protein GCM10010981_03120 [Dyella nitratireducens]|uniref:Secreted protein n=2 Tax=Dyella nitratireducens TaxID=1849580 RepID=A0ABQ1FKP3_9GAMM|nr:hypothetical protein GCM10010981_03120 [Dyella nitratireducens]GLQ44627.1 hypothetical protein GCM10007902_44770 [Dyella nitratireducens]